MCWRRHRERKVSRFASETRAYCFCDWSRLRVCVVLTASWMSAAAAVLWWTSLTSLSTPSWRTLDSCSPRLSSDFRIRQCDWARWKNLSDTWRRRCWTRQTSRMGSDSSGRSSRPSVVCHSFCYLFSSSFWLFCFFLVVVVVVVVLSHRSSHLISICVSFSLFLSLVVLLFAFFS